MRNSRMNKHTVKQPKKLLNTLLSNQKLLASTDRVQKTHLEIRMNHHNATVALPNTARGRSGDEYRCGENIFGGRG
jgi:hypothetical protein